MLATGLTVMVKVGATGGGAVVTVKGTPTDVTDGDDPVNSLENTEVPVATTTPPDIHPPGGHELVTAYT
jgi:hypothetical protein